MATIAEIIAARQAGKSAAPAPSKATAAAPTKPKESIAERLETEAAMDRIDPPGKRKAAGLVLTSHALPKGENRGQATEIKGPEPIERSLGETVGQGVPMVPVNADAPTAAWHFALQALETELCAMRDPREPEVVWLALRHADKPELPPLLLHRLPILLWAHPDEIKPDNHPF